MRHPHTVAQRYLSYGRVHQTPKTLKTNGTTIASTRTTAMTAAILRWVFLLFMFIMAVHPFSKGYYI